jgi:hypothetical protein
MVFCDLYFCKIGRDNLDIAGVYQISDPRDQRTAGRLAGPDHDVRIKENPAGAISGHFRNPRENSSRMFDSRRG